MRIAVSLFTIWILMISIGCRANQITPESIASPVPPPSQGEIIQMPTSPLPVDAGIQNLIEKAKADLAQRLSISTTQISLVESMEVEWSDSSLGCPQPGMYYLQVITPGYLIRLQALDRIFEFHTNKSDQIIYCDHPSEPLPSTRPDR